MNLISQDAIDVERWRRIESVLDPALDLEPHLIPDYLDRACAGSPSCARGRGRCSRPIVARPGSCSVPALAMVDPSPTSDDRGGAGGVL